MPIWGITIQNEPEAKQVWDSCLYTGEEERDFIKNCLGPSLEKYGHSDVKIIIWDHNRDVIFDRAKAVLSDPEAGEPESIGMCLRNLRISPGFTMST